MIRRPPRSPLFPYTTLSRSTRRHLVEVALQTIGRDNFTAVVAGDEVDRKSTRLNSSHSQISYAVFCLKKKKTAYQLFPSDRRQARGRTASVTADTTAR